MCSLKQERGFTLIELIAVIILLAIISAAIGSHFSDQKAASVQSSRDDVIAALFFAQQTAMARGGVEVSINSEGNSITVTENGAPIKLHSDAYPLSFPEGIEVKVDPEDLGVISYNKLGQASSPATITVKRGNVSATINLETSGYAHY